MIKLAGDTAFGTGNLEEKGEYTHNLTSAQRKKLRTLTVTLKHWLMLMMIRLRSLIVGW